MEEIKAGDIMIGNYYRYQFNDKICKVESIVKDDNWYGGYKVISECGQITGIGGCSPIPLTEERLLKAGFVIGGYNLIEVTHPNHHRLFFVLGETYNSIWWNYNMSGTPEDSEPSQIEIKYIHQLQNLFKLITGNDLKIEV